RQTSSRQTMGADPMRTAPSKKSTLPPAVAPVTAAVKMGDAVVSDGLDDEASGWTSIVWLVASFTIESFRNNRTLYVPGVTGMVKTTSAPVTPTTGAVRVPFR